MRKRQCIWVWLFILGTICSAQRGGEGSQAGQEFVGTWTGTWDGAGSGGFELTLEKGKDGGTTGRVSVTGEPTYKATFRTLSFDGKKMSARYDFPPNEGAEVVLAATFEDGKATGTWSLRDKANDSEVASGTWTVARK